MYIQYYQKRGGPCKENNENPIEVGAQLGPRHHSKSDLSHLCTYVSDPQTRHFCCAKRGPYIPRNLKAKTSPGFLEQT